MKAKQARLSGLGHLGPLLAGRPAGDLQTQRTDLDKKYAHRPPFDRCATFKQSA
jgi:hypothetical protein